MRNLTLVVLCTLAFFGTALAQVNVGCNAVLAPSVEQAREDYRLAQSYMSVNAGLEYDKKMKGEKSVIDAGGSYTVYQLEFAQSKSKQDFEERVRQLHKRENSSMESSEARSYYRTGVSDKQVEAWAGCVGNGGLLLTARFSGKDGFVLIVRRMAQEGVGTTNLDIQVVNGKIYNLSRLSVPLNGNERRNYFVVPDSKSQRVVVLARVTGFSDEISIPRVKPVPAKPPAIIEINRYNDKFGQTGNIADGFKTSFMSRQPPHGMWQAELPADQCSPGPGGYQCKVGWIPNAPEAGRYELWVEYATTESRPMEVRVDQAGNPNIPRNFIALSRITPSPTEPQWFLEGEVTLQKGNNHLWFVSMPRQLPPLINAVRLVKRR